MIKSGAVFWKREEHSPVIHSLNKRIISSTLTPDQNRRRGKREEGICGGEGEKSKLGFTVYPSSQVSTSIVEPYNSLSPSAIQPTSICFDRPRRWFSFIRSRSPTISITNDFLSEILLTHDLQVHSDAYSSGPPRRDFLPSFFVPACWIDPRLLDTGSTVLVFSSD
ncbi:hypothetical protein LXL04_017019 [Taraxacum kok-saghyz]